MTYIPYMTQAYGGAPLNQPWDQIPRVQPLTQDGGGALTFYVEPLPEPHEVTVAARVDADGRLWLRITVDGKHVSETSTDAKQLTLTEKI